MRFAPFPPRFGGLILAVALLAPTACAHGIPEADPADIPRLREAVEANPQDTDLQVQLGMAQYKAEDYEQARTILQSAVEAGNESGAALLYLGLSEEQFEDWPAARDAYTHYLDVGRSEPLKAEIRKRLELIAQNVLRQQAAQALAQETELSGAEPTPRSLAVFPFGFNSDREDLEPLIYALSDMMITDFAVSNALTVLERAQIQTLLDEMSLTEAGYAEPGTGARAGRLLRAEHVVQGVITTIGQEDLRLDTDVLNIVRGASAGTLTGEDALENLFDLEKDLVFRTIRDILGVELTPAEEQRIRDNRAQNVLAFLAYGRGLRERDRGNYEGALAEFRQAQELDPGFDAAGTAVNDTEGLSDATAAGTSGLESTATSTGEVGGGGAVAPPPPTTGTVGLGTTGSTEGTSGTLGGVAEGVDPNPTSGTLDLGSTTTTSEGGQPGEKRDPVQESQGQETATTTTKAQIRIVIKRPGGGE